MSGRRLTTWLATAPLLRTELNRHSSAADCGLSALRGEGRVEVRREVWHQVSLTHPNPGGFSQALAQLAILEETEHCYGQGFAVPWRDRQSRTVVHHEVEASTACHRRDCRYAERSSFCVYQPEPFATGYRSGDVRDA